MKKLHPFLLPSIFVVLIFATTLFASCSADKCRNLICENGGVCEMEESQWIGGKHGVCHCAVGFETDDYTMTSGSSNCKMESRVKLFGNYLLDGSDNIGGTYSNLNTSIVTSSAGKTKFAMDVSGTFNLSCSMSSSYTFIIDPTTISGYTYSGSGEYSYNDSLSLSVTKTDGIDTIVYSLSGPKQ